MECVRPPVSLEDANAIISACAGTADWRPLFLTGLVTVVVVLVIVLLVIQVVKSVVR